MNSMGAQPAGAFVTIMGGKLTFQKDLALPALKEIVPAIEAQGLPNEPDYIASEFGPVPLYPVPKGPTNTFGFDDLVVGLGLYLAGRIGETGVQRLIDRLYDRQVQPVLEQMWQKIRRSRRPPLKTRMVFDHWFNRSGVLVRTIILIEPEAENIDVRSLVAQTLEQATHYIHKHPVTHRVLTYEVIDGRLTGVPILTEPVQ